MTVWVTMEHVDALPVQGVTLADLDLDRVAHHLERAHSIEATAPLDYLLQRQGVIAHDDGFVPTLGGMLCFGREPQRWLPHTGIALTRYKGHKPNSQQVIDIRDLRGSLFDMIDEAEEYLWTQSAHGFHLEAGLQRIPFDQYPRTALRELIVNAVAHRDYRVSGSRVKIELFHNLIEWSSPGGLPPGITVQNILKSQYTRNPVVVGFLFDAGYIKQRGMGIDTVVDALEQEGLPLPQMEDTGANFFTRIVGHGQVSLLYDLNLEPTVDRLYRMGLDLGLAQVYSLLERAGEQGTRVKDLSRQTGISPRTISRRLQELIDRGLVRRVGSTNNTSYGLAEFDDV